jgi:hypothetical protein
MRRSAVLVIVGLALGVACLAPSVANAAEFTQCPPVFKDTGCKFLIVVTNTGVTVEEDPTQEPFYEGADDTLFGIENKSSSPITQLPLSAPNDIFGFDEDGICNPGGLPVPPGCVVLAKNAKGEPTNGEVTPGGGSTCEVQDGACGFEPSAGEPLTTTFPEGIGLAGFSKSGIPVTGYEGPTSWYSNLSSGFNSGIVNFSPAIAPGSSTYFGLEEAPSVLIGSPTTLSTSLSGGGQSGPSISVVQGTPVTDGATVGGSAGAAATGEASYAIYSDAGCITLVTAAGSAAVSGGVAGPSTAESALAPGKYYWQAHYGGDINNQAVSSTCGSEILTVLAPTATTTVQSAGGVSGASLTVPKGTAVTDQAHITGTLAASATGTVSYTLYKDNKCTVPAAPASSVIVTGGAAGASAGVKPGVGTYYWKASYSGDAVNAPSTSTCGSEVLTVALQANVGLPSSKICLSRRKFIAHPRAPKGVKLVFVQVFINGKLKSQGKLTHNHTTINLIGLPKGTFKVAMVVKSSTGKLYEDVRTFHTCVPKKRKK